MHIAFFNSIAPRIPPAPSYGEVLSMGCWVEGGWVGEPRGRGAKRTENSAGRAAKRSDQERQRTTWTDFGASKGSVLRLGGGLGVRLGTLWGTLGGKGTTFEPQGFQKWVPPIGGAHSGTILELPGWIWGAILGSFWGLFGYFFG